MMPDIDGIEIYEALQTSEPGILKRFVFMTGGTFTEHAHQFLQGVDNPCIEKPFHANTIQNIVARMVGPSASAKA